MAGNATERLQIAVRRARWQGSLAYPATSSDAPGQGLPTRWRLVVSLVGFSAMTLLGGAEMITAFVGSEPFIPFVVSVAFVLCGAALLGLNAVVLRRRASAVDEF